MGQRLDVGVPGWRDAVERLPRLDAEAEAALVRRAQAGDPQARRRLIEANLRLVLRLAQKLSRYGIPVAELMSDGTLGLLEAVDRFEVERGLRFSTYAASWVRAHVLTRLTSELAPHGASRGAFRTKYWFALRRESARLTALGLDREARVAALSEQLGVSRGKVAEMLEHLQQRRVPVADEGGDEVRGQALRDPAPPPDELAHRARQQARFEGAVAEALAALQPRDREVIQARLMTDEPPSLAVVGRSHGISRERVRQLEARSKERLRQSLAPLAD